MRECDAVELEEIGRELKKAWSHDGVEVLETGAEFLEGVALDEFGLVADHVICWATGVFGA